MDVILILNDDEGTIVYFEEGSNYHFSQHGLLVTVLPDGVERIWSPHAWSHLQDGCPGRTRPVVALNRAVTELCPRRQRRGGLVEHALVRSRTTEPGAAGDPPTGALAVATARSPRRLRSRARCQAAEAGTRS